MLAISFKDGAVSAAPRIIAFQTAARAIPDNRPTYGLLCIDMLKIIEF